MSENRFPICTPIAPALIGREQIMTDLIRELTKENPSHRSLVGARYIGKSVILTELVQRITMAGLYTVVILWDLGHNTPRSDETFLQVLSLKLAEGLKTAGEHDYGDHLRLVKADFYAEIEGVLDALATEEKRVLMLWDGFDKPLTAGTLTRNLWDNLRELCLKPSLRLVTASRRKLSELIRDEKSVTSDFWNIFGDVIRVVSFQEADIDATLATLSTHTFTTGAKTELINWSGGNPPLLLSLLNALVTKHESGEIDNDHINQAVENLEERVDDILEAIWSDCSPSAQDLRRSLDSTGISLAETAITDRDALTEKGFALVTGQKLLPKCRLLDRRLGGVGAESGSMARLFGTCEDYKTNITEVVKRRLSHIPRFEERLYRFVEIAVNLLDSDPESALNNLTSIEERALDIIWDRECEIDKKIPKSTVNYWTESSRCKHKIVSEMMGTDNFEIPSDRWKQLGVLQLLTGSYAGFDTKARTATKDAYVLLNAIHSLRNRTQHADGQQIHLEVAAATLLLCVELLACLAQE